MTTTSSHPDDADAFEAESVAERWPEVTGTTPVADPDPQPGAAAVPRTGLRARRRGIDRKLLLASLALAIGALFIALGLRRGVTGDDVTNLPDAIERITPAPDDEQVLQQTQVTVDLAEGYEGELTVDGVALATVRLDQLSAVDVEPGQQIDVPPGARFEPGNGTLTFTPTEGTAVETFDPGSHSVSVSYWKSEEGRDAARSYAWTFVVI